MHNIALIGMPGSGKSTTGIVLARAMNYNFIDTDILIQNQENRLLQDIITDEGISNFLNIESRVITTCDYERTVIATGGSAVLMENTMHYLADISTVIYLKLSLENIKQRVNNIHTRGIVMESGQTLDDVFETRTPLYSEFADIIINCNNREFEEVISDILSKLNVTI